MSKITLLLAAFTAALMVALIAPNILVANRGKILRNTAIWLAIIVGLAIIYKQIYGGGLPVP